MFLKIRKARELDWDLPGVDSAMVDNRNWRKLIEMEKKAYKIIEEIAKVASSSAKGGGSPIKVGLGGIDENSDDDEVEVSAFQVLAR